MAQIRIPCLIPRTNKAGITSWYWQPSKTLAAAGFKPLALGKDEGAAIAAARARNLEVERWKSGAPMPAAFAQRSPLGTLGALIDRYEREVLHGKDPRGTPLIAASTARTYRTSLKRLREWGGDTVLAVFTPARIRALRDAMIAPAEKGGIGHHAAHQALKMGRALFAFAESVDLTPRGSNPFAHFRLAAPAPRDVIWSPPAREAMVLTAYELGKPSMALAIMLGFAIGQREADLLALSQRQYVPLSEHKCRPDDYAVLAARAPDGVPRAVRLRQGKTKVWIEVPVVGLVRLAIEDNVAAAQALGTTQILLDDTRRALYSGAAGQTRFQRDFAEIREWAVAFAQGELDDDLAEELAGLQFRDLRRTCVVYLGELGMDAHQIAAITGHDLDETMRILKTYMPMTTGRAASTIAQIERRTDQDAERKEQRA